ncbi:MAG TPA: hypothetical protein VJI68_03040 [Candidatus Nanoarchaeia archaeon]|nr:hypothetical protein [Candidatus Nanoarchaeia archaeon]
MVKPIKENINRKADADIYNEVGREELEEADEITEVEEGFMEGFEEGETLAKCAFCKKVLVGEDFVEEEIDEVHYRFCNEDHALKFEEKKKFI